jgi:flagellar biosynthesis/type III secretory pathway M-ring protein FliF/YscJ
MSFRDLGIIELTVFAVLAAAFLLFFILFVILRRRKAANNRKFLKRQSLMEEAVQKKVRYATERGSRIGGGARSFMQAEEYGTYTPQERARERVQKITRIQGNTDFAGQFQEEFAEENSPQNLEVSREFSAENPQKGQDVLRMWDNNSKSLRMAKRAQDSTFFVEERRISHRRDQLKRLEEAE